MSTITRSPARRGTNAVATLWALELRRDRLQLPVWILGNAAMAGLAVTGVTQSYGTETDRSTLLATAIANPVILTFRGLPSGAGTAEFIGFLILPFLVMIAGFMSSFLAVRHTRAEEESGRAELVGATTASRGAALWATTLHGVIANVITALAITVAFTLAGLPLRGSMVAGLATGAAGLVFLGIALVGAQLFATARGANSLGVIAILVTFLISGVGNAIGTPNADLTRMESSPLAWFSPFGWAENVRPFADDAVGPLVLLLIAAAVAVLLAYVLLRQRDVGASLVAPRRGRAAARWSLRGPVTLVGRLTRGSIIAWAVGAFLTGALATSLASVVQSMGGSNPAIAAVLEAMSKSGDLQAGTVVIFFTVVGILASCCTVQIVARARQEEARGTVEPLWAASVGRRRWLASYLIIGAVAIVAVDGAAVLGSLVGLSRTGADLIQDVWIGAAGQAAVAAVFLTVTALVLVVIPRWTIGIGWTIVVLATIIGLFGPLFGLPDRLTQLSPFSQTPTLTATGVDGRGIIGILAAAVVALVLSVWLVRRRPLVTAG
ncbi:ABC transporter permease [Microbacterium sp. ZW T5_56]|uniref:ABC transporter permease n=1 Tax=Microbacterium sp. ZW T5_56 TaxID=3378081 RepID=UPI0038548F84